MTSREKLLSSLGLEHGTKMEFSYNSLWGPNVYQVLTPTQVGDLYELATSIKYNSKIKFKYKTMDEIMAKSGFREFHAGTNRRIYHHLDFKQLMAKVALDDEGLRDNPSEYRNQSIFAPYCTKVFDVTPEGAVEFVERFEPILNRRMFELYADDIFYIIDKVIDGRYAVADIGTLYFMNYGIRPGFGPGFLDFPYAYKLDGNKLYCRAELPDGSRCNGVIDYDRGFNELICNHCGKVYQARDLELAVTNNEIDLIGGISMNLKMQVQVGNKVVFDNTNDIDTTDSLEPTSVKGEKKPDKPVIIVEKGKDKYINGELATSHDSSEYSMKKDAFKDQIKKDKEDEDLKRIQRFNAACFQEGVVYQVPNPESYIEQGTKKLKEEENNAIIKKLEHMNQMLKNFESKVDALETERQNLLGRNKELAQQVAGYEEKIRAYETEMTGQFATYKEKAEKVIKKLTQEIAAKDNKIAVLSKDLKEVKETLYGERSKNEELEEMNRVLQEESDKKDATIAGYIEQEEEFERNRRALENEANKIRNHMLYSSRQVEVIDPTDRLKTKDGTLINTTMIKSRFNPNTAITTMVPFDFDMVPGERSIAESVVEEAPQYTKVTKEDIENMVPSEKPKEVRQLSDDEVEEIVDNREKKQEEEAKENEEVKEDTKEIPPKAINISQQQKKIPPNVVRSNLQEDPLAEGSRNNYGNKKKKGKGKKRHKGNYVKF